MKEGRPIPLARPEDFYRVFGWAGTKLLYMVLPLSVLRRLARLQGALEFSVAKRKGLVLARLERVFGDRLSAAERRRVARRHFQYRRLHLLVKALEASRRRGLWDGIEIEGLDHLDAAVAEGKGVILVCAHCGYTRAVKPALRLRGYRVLLVGRQDLKRPRASRFEAFVRGRVLRLGRFSRPDDADLPTGLNLRPLLDALARNEIVLVLVDGRQASSVHPVSLLGGTVHLSPGAVSIARSTGARALPAFAVDGSRGLGIRIEIGPPLAIQRSGTAAEDLRTNLGAVAQTLERYHIEYPHLWWWSHRHDRLPSQAGQTSEPSQARKIRRGRSRKRSAPVAR